MTSIYNTGTVTVTNGNAVVAGSGTAWAVALVTGGFFSCAGLAIPILSVDSDTQITLVYAWPGTTAAGAAYAIDRENSSAANIVDLYDKLSRVLVTLSLAGITPNSSGTLTDRAALTLAMGDKGYLFLHAEIGVAFAFYRWNGTSWDGPFAVGNAAAGGPVSSLVAGSNVTIDNTNPAIPVISASGTPVETAVHAATGKTTPVDADEMALVDSAATFGLKKLTWANLKAGVLAYFNGTAKATPIAADRVYIGDSAASNAVKYSTWTQILAAIFGTAAVKNTGTSGNTVPLLDGANTWSAQQTMQSTSAFSTPLVMNQSEDGAGTGPFFSFRRTSASPTAADAMGSLLFEGYNSAAALVQYAYMRALIDDPTSTSEDGQVQIATLVGGAATIQMYIGGGVALGAATGGRKGTGTLNATDVYNDNVALTCMAMADEFRRDGEISLEKWDALVPDIEIPECVETIPETIEVEVARTVDERDADGSLIRKAIVERREIPLVILEPVWDADGNGVDAVPQAITREVVTPAKIIKRIHGTARVFKAMCDDGFDPRDPEQYFAKMQVDEALPGMPTQSDWQHNSLGMGELFSRKWLAMEMLAIVSNMMWVKIKDHELRISAIEAHQ